jgi:hypothetical protein
VCACQEREEPIPLIFAHTRRTLSRTLGRSLKSSVVAILNYDGANAEFKQMVALAKERQAHWRGWAARPEQQEASRAYERQLREELGEELFARRQRMQLQCLDERLIYPPRSLVLEPKRTAPPGPPAPGQPAPSTERRFVDPIMLSLGLHQ